MKMEERVRKWKERLAREKRSAIEEELTKLKTKRFNESNKEKEKLKNYWCSTCENYRTHEMKTEELGICRSCGSKNWAPMGHGD